MKANLVYKTGDNYINLFENRLEFIDYSCTNQVKTEEKLRDIFSMEIDNKDGEFKILINPQELNIKEVKYHKNVDNMYDFSDLEELDVRFDCCDKEEFMRKIANMMINSKFVLSGLNLTTISSLINSILSIILLFLNKSIKSNDLICVSPIL